MSGKRIDADLGFLSLALAEARDTVVPLCPEHRSADGLRLRALLASPPRESSEDIPKAQDAQDECARTPKPFDTHQRLKWLAELLHGAQLSRTELRERSVSLRFPSDLLKEANLEVRRIGRVWDFELTIGDVNSRAWVCDKLIELVDMLASRIDSPFAIRIVDLVSASVVAEAGNESDGHPWHRASFCEN